MVKLTLDDRDMLVVRMQAYAYENVNIGDMPKAERVAGLYLARFDDMMEHNPTDSEGFWAGHFFNYFKRDCDEGFLG